MREAHRKSIKCLLVILQIFYKFYIIFEFVNLIFVNKSCSTES